MFTSFAGVEFSGISSGSVTYLKIEMSLYIGGMLKITLEKKNFESLIKRQLTKTSRNLSGTLS